MVGLAERSVTGVLVLPDTQGVVVVVGDIGLEQDPVSPGRGSLQVVV